METNSVTGHVVIALGFFAFVGLGYVALMLFLAAREQHKQGLSDLNPCGCIVAAFLTLLLTAWARGCALH